MYDNFRANKRSKAEEECLNKHSSATLAREDTGVKGYLEILGICTKNETVDEILGALERLKSEFDKNYDSRIYAAQNGAYELILDVLTGFQDESKLVRSALKPMIRLTSCQPNLLNEEGVKCLMNLLKGKLNLSNAQLLLRWVKQCCIKSERNRQDIFDAGVVNEVKNILQDEFLPESKLQDVCSLLRSLTLDDDPAYDYGNSVGRTCEIANDILAPITILLQKFKYTKKVVAEISRTLSTLLIRNQFCKKVQDADGLDHILGAMVSFPNDEDLNCSLLRLVKVLAGNDDVKVHLVTQGAAHLVVSAMSRIQTGAVSVAGLGCIAALTLRSPRNSGIFYHCEAPGLIIETMKRYPGSINVQRYGTLAVSNMTIMNKIEAKTFGYYDVEMVLEMAMKIHGDQIADEVETAFCNLGLKPELKDHWTRMK